MGNQSELQSLPPRVRRRIQAMLGRLKGNSIEALEKIEKVVAQSLQRLRADGSGADLPGNMVQDLHTARTCLGKLLSNQQQARTIVDMLDMLDMLDIKLKEPS